MYNAFIMKNNNHFKKIHPIFLFVLLLISCGPNETGVEETTPRTADDVRQDFSNLNINPGINDISLETITNNVFWKFRIVAPDNASDTNKRPLIISLHGGARNILPDAHKSSGCILSSGFDTLNAYVISPNSDGKLWFEQENQAQVLALVDLASTYLHVDTTRIGITGFSDGGNGSWFFSQYFPSIFSAGIPIATSYNTSSNGSTPRIEVPLYVIHGSEDELFPLVTTQAYVDASIAAGTDIEFVIANGLTHFSNCSEYLTYLQDAVAWLNTTWN